MMIYLLTGLATFMGGRAKNTALQPSNQHCRTDRSVATARDVTTFAAGPMPMVVLCAIMSRHMGPIAVLCIASLDTRHWMHLVGSFDIKRSSAQGKHALFMVVLEIKG